MVGLNLKYIYKGEEVDSLKKLKRMKGADLDGYLLYRILEGCPKFVEAVQRRRQETQGIDKNDYFAPHKAATKLIAYNLLDHTDFTYIYYKYLAPVILDGTVRINREMIPIHATVVPENGTYTPLDSHEVHIVISGPATTSDIEKFVSDNRKKLDNDIKRSAKNLHRPTLGVRRTETLERTALLHKLLMVDKIPIMQAIMSKELNSTNASPEALKRAYTRFKKQVLPMIIPPEFL